MSWGVTTADVLLATGKGATVDEIAPADAVVTIYINRTPAASGGISSRDLTWINQAICWQAVWQRDQPGYESRSQFDELEQDGLRVKTDAEWAKVLAPLAARAIKNLSWKANRSQRILPVATRQGLNGVADFELETSDRLNRWEHL